MDDIFESTESTSDGEEEEISAAEVLQKLEEAWLNEKFSPELLETKTEIVECMMDQIKEMEENISRAKKGDFKVSVHRMELDRIRFILSSYLRTRLEKIEKNTQYILEQESNRPETDAPHLSPEEYAFAKEFQDHNESHYKQIALRHMPPNLQTLDPKLAMVRPNLDSYVFLRVNQNTEGVLVDEETIEAREEIIDLEKGNQHIIKYRPVAPLVNSAAVALI
ncbi:unnamed protein product [Owenia fusiformis]|uniref:DNA replication complex GINS protein SLD5 n=1 Tax=Owenia fusiformis TaxID=6347 RepID=A0A8J1T5D0_OWEFU|nr:unnamed protein product [Owenia fusiformis]